MTSFEDPKSLIGPSIGAVKYETEHYEVILKNITLEGFTHTKDKPILTAADDRHSQWPKAFEEWKAKYGKSRK